MPHNVDISQIIEDISLAIISLFLNIYNKIRFSLELFSYITKRTGMDKDVSYLPRNC